MRISVKSTPERLLTQKAENWNKTNKQQTFISPLWTVQSICPNFFAWYIRTSMSMTKKKKQWRGGNYKTWERRLLPCILHVEGSQLTDHKAAFTALIQTVRLQGNKFKVGGGKRSQRAVTILNRHLAAFISAKPVLQVGNWNICLLPRFKAALQTSSIILAGLQW